LSFENLLGSPYSEGALPGPDSHVCFAKADGKTADDKTPALAVKNARRSSNPLRGSIGPYSSHLVIICKCTDSSKKHPTSSNLSQLALFLI
jgi:hypothetical protein